MLLNRITDMIKGTVTVTEISQMKTAYEMIKNNFVGLDILRVQHFMLGSAFHIKVNFSYLSSIIGEVVIEYGRKPSNLYANEFL